MAIYVKEKNDLIMSMMHMATNNKSSQINSKMYNGDKLKMFRTMT